jgi:hypothetical protein
VAVTAGTRQLQVQAKHVNGMTATTAGQTVIAKTNPPTFPTAATLTFRTAAQVSATTAPVTLSWVARDTVKLSSVALTAPSARSFSTTSTAYGTTAAIGRETNWSLTAKDLVGNAATSAVARTPVLVSELSGTRTGSWTTRTGSTSTYLAGKALYTKSRGAKLTWTFTGRGMALVVARTPASGKADVYVNGVKVATLDLRSSSNAYRQVIYARSVSRSPAKTTVQIVNQATTGRPGITLDGLVYFR